MKRPAVHIQTARGLGHVAVAKLINPLNVLPTNTVCAHGVFGRRRKLVFMRKKRGCHVIGVSGLRQVVRRADLHGGNGGRNRAVTGEDDDPAVRSMAAQRRPIHSQGS